MKHTSRRTQQRYMTTFIKPFLVTCSIIFALGLFFTFTSSSSISDSNVDQTLADNDQGLTVVNHIDDDVDDRFDSTHPRMYTDVTTSAIKSDSIVDQSSTDRSLGEVDDGFGSVDTLSESSVDQVLTRIGDDLKGRVGSEKREVVGKCASVEEMGEGFDGEVGVSSLRIRKLIQEHFEFKGASRVGGLPPEEFCQQGFVLAKASEAGFGNEMYKILTAAALSIMLNRSLIVGQSRGRFPFGEYISYANVSFTLHEVKHLWRQHKCELKYGRQLNMRIDDFEKPIETHVLCSNWREWEQPIIWFQGTTDAVAIQFFLKNIHQEMRDAASKLFGRPEALRSRPNIFGELMRFLISPSKDVEEAVKWVLNGGEDPDMTLHMRMLMNRSRRAVQAALTCIYKALSYQPQVAKPRIVLVTDTPSLILDIAPNLTDFAEILRFEYKAFRGSILSVKSTHSDQLQFRAKDWGPAPRWVAFVDFFLASRAKHAVVSGAHRRVGTTYAQLIAALAAAHQLEENSPASTEFAFFSSFQSNLLSDGLTKQIGWGHVWNRFAGPLSCHSQASQCALTPILPPAWWDGTWQSPLPRDIKRLLAFGVHLNTHGQVNDSHLQSYCTTRKNSVKIVRIFGQ